VVRAEHLTPIGNEVIVDPTDTGEGLTAEEPSATEVLEFETRAEGVEALRRQIKAIGVNATERASGISLSEAQALVNESAPRASHRS
jgi:hypothetical protein